MKGRRDVINNAVQEALPHTLTLIALPPAMSHDTIHVWSISPKNDMCYDVLHCANCYKLHRDATAVVTGVN